MELESPCWAHDGTWFLQGRGGSRRSEWSRPECKLDQWNIKAIKSRWAKEKKRNLSGSLKSKCGQDSCWAGVPRGKKNWQKVKISAYVLKACSPEEQFMEGEMIKMAQMKRWSFLRFIELSPSVTVYNIILLPVGPALFQLAGGCPAKPVWGREIKGSPYQCPRMERWDSSWRMSVNILES